MEKKEAKENNNPHLVLNFDINKTLILKDKTKNYNFEKCVKSSLVNYAWGIYNESTKEWTLTENYLSFKKPKPDLINYYYYMKIAHKGKTEKEIPDIKERFKKNQEIKRTKEKLFQIFLDKGQPGENGGELATVADVCIKAPSNETYIVQEYHLPIYHCLCLMLEDAFFGE